MNESELFKSLVEKDPKGVFEMIRRSNGEWFLVDSQERRKILVMYDYRIGIDIHVLHAENFIDAVKDNSLIKADKYAEFLDQRRVRAEEEYNRYMSCKDAKIDMILKERENRSEACIDEINLPHKNKI